MFSVHTYPTVLGSIRFPFCSFLKDCIAWRGHTQSDFYVFYMKVYDVWRFVSVFSFYLLPYLV